MAVLKCKMCGGDLEIAEGGAIAVCEYCGAKQTVPSPDDEKKLSLFARAERMRRACEFDKAAGLYETLAASYPKDAECFWGLVLCKYGIEYVDDPATGRKIPTCHRSSYRSVPEDADYKQALACAAPVPRHLYEEQAAELETIRQKIAELSAKEEPYDVFISYKDTDASGDRTEDSVQAQNIYDALTTKGYKAFFSRITLENRLGQDYEPIIFSALHSARVMLVVGTELENLEAVWVKNEWKRYLQMIDAGEKKTLIPCYLDLDPRYDLPGDFTERRLQAQDLSKIGAVQDLVRGVEKLVKPEPQSNFTPIANGPNVEALVIRAEQALQEGEWNEAEEIGKRILDTNAESSDAYQLLAMCSTKCRTWEEYAKRCLGRDDYQSKELSRAVKYDYTFGRAAALDRQCREAIEQRRQHAQQLRDEKRQSLAEKRRTARLLSGIERYMYPGGHRYYLKMDGNVYRDDGARISEGGQTVAFCCTDQYSKMDMACLQADGTVRVYTNYKPGLLHRRAMPYELELISGWTQLTQLRYSVQKRAFFGLTADGRLLRSTNNPKETPYILTDVLNFDENMTSWDIYVRHDGSLYSGESGEDFDEDFPKWKDLVTLLDCGFHGCARMGLTGDGGILCSMYQYRDSLWYEYRSHILEAIGSWSDIVQINYVAGYLQALRSDGRVFAVYMKSIDSNYVNRRDVFSKMEQSKLDAFNSTAEDYSDDIRDAVAIADICDTDLSQAAIYTGNDVVYDHEYCVLEQRNSTFSEQFGCPLDEYVRILKERIARGGLQK